MHTAEEIDVRAWRRAILMLGRDYAPLGRIQRIVIACAAVARARPALDSELPLIEQEAILIQAAQAALALARSEEGEALREAARHTMLLGDIKQLPELQQLALVLRHLHGLNDRQIASILDCCEQDVADLANLALDTLRPHLGAAAP